MLKGQNGFVQFTILTACEDQNNESVTINESSGTCSTGGGKCVKYPKNSAFGWRGLNFSTENN